MNKHYDDVASIGCILCLQLGYGSTPAEIHHIRRLGAIRKRSPVIPLCLEHHRGNTGIHGLGRKAFTAKYGLTEYDLLDKTEELITHER
jgi:hypothetical protein